MSERPGRNDPCPCGSGAKYKKCCVEKDDAARVAAAAAQAAAAPAAAQQNEARRSARAQPQAHRPDAASRKMATAARRRSV